MESIRDSLTQVKSSFLAFCCAVDPTWIPSPFHVLLANRLQQAWQTPNGRLLVSVPPRHGKSRLISELFPAWVLGVNPFQRLQAISYSASLARSFGLKTRSLMSDPVYKTIFPWARIAGRGRGGGEWLMDRAEALNYPPQPGWVDFDGNIPSYPGQYLAVGVGGSLTGKPADLQLIDDPIKNRAQADSQKYIDGLHNFFRADAFSRLEPGASCIVVHTRWSPRDLIGLILSNQEEFGVWEYLRLPAIAEANDPLGRSEGEPLFPQKYGLEDLERIRRTVGDQEWNALYQQNPREGGGNRWKSEYLLYRSDPPDFVYRFVSWDCASELHDRADYTAYCVFGVDTEGRLWLIDSQQARLDFNGLIATLTQVDLRYRPDLHLVERASNGVALVQYAQANLPRVPLEPSDFAYRRKQIEFSLACGLLETQPVLVTGSAEELRAQAEVWPGGEHDDLFIAFLQGVRHAQQNPVPSSEKSLRTVSRGKHPYFYGYRGITQHVRL